MKITDESLAHLASLSRLTLSEKEKVALKTDLNNILNYVKKLDDLDVEGITPTFQVTGLSNVFRPDEILPQDASPADLLALAPESVNNQIKVPKVL